MMAVDDDEQGALAAVARESQHATNACSGCRDTVRAINARSTYDIDTSYFRRDAQV